MPEMKKRTIDMPVPLWETMLQAAKQQRRGSATQYILHACEEQIKRDIESGEYQEPTGDPCPVCGCTMSLQGYCTGCQSRV